MRGTEAVAALAELMPVTVGVDEQVDWDEVEAAWGTRFPSDYVRFMEVYGSGAISDGISILLPSLRAEDTPTGTARACGTRRRTPARPERCAGTAPTSTWTPSPSWPGP